MDGVIYVFNNLVLEVCEKYIKFSILWFCPFRLKQKVTCIVLKEKVIPKTVHCLLSAIKKIHIEFLFQDAFEFFSNLTDQLDEILKVSVVNHQCAPGWSLEIVQDKCIFFFFSENRTRTVI